MKVAVIDSGFGSTDEINYVTGGFRYGSHLCKEGHRDFSGQNRYVKSIPVEGSKYRHGTNIVGVIDATAPNSNYCVVVIKYFHEGIGGEQTVDASVKSIRYANEIGAEIINYSGGGKEPSNEEKIEVKKFLDRGGIFIAAAGNEREQIGVNGKGYYPAMYDPRIIVVGNKTKSGKISYSSNYGRPVKHWEVGENIEGYGITLTGTSQATAVTTGKLLKIIAKGK